MNEKYYIYLVVFRLFLRAECKAEGNMEMLLNAPINSIAVIRKIEKKILSEPNHQKFDGAIVTNFILLEIKGDEKYSV